MSAQAFDYETVHPEAIATGEFRDYVVVMIEGFLILFCNKRYQWKRSHVLTPCNVGGIYVDDDGIEVTDNGSVRQIALTMRGEPKI